MRALIFFILLLPLCLTEISTSNSKHIVVRVTFVIESELYERWLKMFSKKREQTDQAVNYFYSNVFTKARHKLREAFKDAVQFDLVWADSYIERAAGPLEKVLKVRDKRVYFFSSTYLPKLKEFDSTGLNNHKPRDLVVLFTTRFIQTAETLRKNKNKNKIKTYLKHDGLDNLEKNSKAFAVVTEQGLIETVNLLVTRVIFSFFTSTELSKMSTKSFVGNTDSSGYQGVSTDNIQKVTNKHARLKDNIKRRIPKKLDVHPCAPQPSLNKDQQCQFYLGDFYEYCTPEKKEKVSVCKALTCSRRNVKQKDCRRHHDLVAMNGTACHGNNGRCAFLNCVHTQKLSIVTGASA